MAYAATNFHSEQGVIFAGKLREYTEGAVDNTVHPDGSLFGRGDIKRAVQTGQVNIGGRLMSAHTNEAPRLGWNNLPFLATSYADNAKLWSVAKDTVNAQLCPSATGYPNCRCICWPRRYGSPQRYRHCTV